MKLPAACLAATFACGAALGMFTRVTHLNVSFVALRWIFVRDYSARIFVALLAKRVSLRRRQFLVGRLVNAWTSRRVDRFPTGSRQSCLVGDLCRLARDEYGAIHILTDGESLGVSCFVECPDLGTLQPSVAAQTPNQH